MKLKIDKNIFGWAMYDWANSAYTTTVVTGFFPFFFNDYLSTGVDTTLTTARLGLANAVAGLVLAILAPILGAIADNGSAKKKFLIFFAYLGVIMTTGLYFVSEGDWMLATVLFVLATIGFSGGNLFYDSLITGVSNKESSDWISSLGYSLGYLGGGTLLALNVWMYLSPGTFGMESGAHVVKVIFVTVGIWWALFTIPLILYVKEPKNENTKSGFKAVTAGFSQLKRTLKEIRKMKTIVLFLFAYWFYIDGVDTIVKMAGDYGLSLGFAMSDLIVAILIVQFVAFPSALGFGYLGGKIGAKKAIFIGIGVYFVVSIWAYWMDQIEEFYGLAAVIGLVQGGIQALSRSFYSRIIPIDKSAEYFGFYNMLGKFASILGPLLMGGVGLLARDAGYDPNTSTRIGITSIALLFLVGGILFYFVDEEKGIEELKTLND